MLVIPIDDRASSIWFFQRIRLSSSPTSADSLIKYPSRRSILLHTNDMAEPAQPLNINTLYNVYVVEELLQLTIESNVEIIANSH